MTDEVKVEEVKIVTKAGEAPAREDAARLIADVPLSEVSHMTVNFAFCRRACRTLSLGWRNPVTAPKLWLVILICYAAQISGAYMLQSQLYILATGLSNQYPGLSGCITNGCGVCAGGKTCPAPTAGKTVQQPLIDQMNKYYGDFFWMFCVSMALLMIMSFTGDLITSAMRFNAAETIQERIMKNKMLYRLTVDGTLDNVDQRITTDLQVVLDGFCCVLFGNSADYLAYPIAFCISRFANSLSNIYDLSPIPDPIRRGNIIGVILVAVAVAICAYIIPINHVAKVFFRGQKYEGDFRTTHTRALLNCEQIATLNGELAEKDLADRQYNRMDSNQRTYYAWQSVLMILRLFVTICINATAYMSLAVSGVNNSTTANFFQKQAGDVLEYLLYFPVFAERLAYACGATHRVGTLLEHVDYLEATPLKTILIYDKEKVAVTGVRANPPPVLPSNKNKNLGCWCWGSTAKDAEQESVLKRFLFESVNVEVNKGESLCIVGPSGCGKSSLLRVIGGLWGIEEGSVTRPDSVGKDGIFFLPQRAYVFPGSLKAQILYPESESTAKVDLTEVEKVIKLCRLQHLWDRYGADSVQNWPALLSIGEMQCLGFARMFYHKPGFCLADECTSALDLRVESFLYGKCTELGISMISVAHRPTVIPHHTHVFSYTPATHSWSKVPSAQVATCEKFPTDGLDEVASASTTHEEDVVETEDGCGCLFLKRFGRAFCMGVTKIWSQGAIFVFLQLFFCMAIYAALMVVIFKYYGTSVIIAKITGTKGYSVDVQGALNMAGIIIGLQAVNSFVQALSAFFGAWLAIKIQRAIIRYFHQKYFSPGVLYHVNRVMKEKGVDQRMVQDLGGFRESLGWIFGNPFCYCNYRVGALPLGFMWTCLLGYSFSTAGWQLSLFMLIFMVSSYLWQVMCSYLTAPAIERRQRAEGELRGHLGRVLQNVESVTFFGGEPQERESADILNWGVFSKRVEYNCYANLTCIPTITQYYWLQTGVYLMAAVVQVTWAPGAIASADVITTVNFNIQWSKVAELIMMCLGGLGMVIGYTHRVMRVIEKVDEAEVVVQKAKAALTESSDQVCFDKVTVCIPGTENVLLSNLSFTLPPSLCVTGHGKSSVLRVLLGMWPVKSGKVSVPPVGKGGIIFVPQSNYATQGTLAAQVVYPMLESEANATDSELLSILESVGLGEIACRWGLHKVVNWDMVLSGGECQRLGFARVLYQQPKFAVLDETTSALDMANESKCMTALTSRQITLLSFACRPSVQTYHSANLKLTH